MKSERNSYSLIEVVDLIGGGTPKTSISKYWGGDIPWLSVKDFNNDSRYVYSTEKTITNEGLENSSTKLLYKDDIIISARGTVGELAMIPFPMAFNQSCYGIRGKKSIIIQPYLYYLLKDSIRLLKRQTHGSVFDTITRDTFANIEIDLPPISEQQKIVAILSALDDRIENNAKISHHLEQIAQTIFKSWFVDFEPFGGIMPNDWQETPLGTIVQSIDNRGKTPPLSSIPTDYPIIDVKALSGNYRVIDFNNCTKYVEAETFESWFRNGHPKPYDILISTVGSLAEMKLFFGNRGCIAQNVVGFRSKIPLYLYQYLQYIKDDLVSYNIGSVQPSIKVTHIIKHSIILPTDGVLKMFNEIVKPITETIYNNHCESEYLAVLRDTLLPRLMSGELICPIQEHEE